MIIDLQPLFPQAPQITPWHRQWFTLLWMSLGQWVAWVDVAKSAGMPDVDAIKSIRLLQEALRLYSPSYMLDSNGSSVRLRKRVNEIAPKQRAGLLRRFWASV